MNGWMECEKEIMSENEECLFEHSSCESLTSVICVGNDQTMTQDCERPWNHMQHANLLLDDPTSSETSWTNEKHSLYLNSIEEAFVSNLYQQGCYTYPCKRWQAERGDTSSVLSLDLNEEVESGFSDARLVFGFSEESQSESEMPRIPRHVQNHSKRCRLKMCGSSNTFPEPDRNEKRSKRKLQHEVADPDREITHVLEEEVQSRHGDECASNFYAGQDRFTQNSSVSETLMRTISDNQEDQVVPTINEESPKEDGEPR